MWTTQVCELGHEHRVLKCNVCHQPVNPEQMGSIARYVSVWPVELGDDTASLAGVHRGALAVVCGESCLREVGQILQDQSV